MRLRAVDSSVAEGVSRYLKPVLKPRILSISLLWLGDVLGMHPPPRFAVRSYAPRSLVPRAEMVVGGRTRKRWGLVRPNDD